MTREEKTVKDALVALLHLAQDYRGHKPRRSWRDLADDIGVGGSSLYNYANDAEGHAVPASVLVAAAELAWEVAPEDAAEIMREQVFHARGFRGLAIGWEEK